jgi:hypothetical protein
MSLKNQTNKIEIKLGGAIAPPSLILILLPTILNIDTLYNKMQEKKEGKKHDNKYVPPFAPNKQDAQSILRDSKVMYGLAL